MFDYFNESLTSQNKFKTTSICSFLGYIVFRFLISNVNVYCQSLVAIFQCTEVLLQFLTMSETEAIAEYDYVVR